MKIKIGICQFDIQEGKHDRNLAKAEELLTAAAKEGGEILMLPEMWPSGFDFANINSIAEALDGETVSFLKEQAIKLNVHLIGGSFAEADGGKVYNTCPVIDSHGKITAIYRKVHLFSHYLNEHLYLSPGNEWVLSRYRKDEDTIILGHMICYDLRFPEFARNLALRGARLLCAPAGWPQRRVRELEILCQARAIENRSFLICANYTDTANGEYCGNSLIIDPFGNILAKLGNNEDFAIAEIDTSLLDQENTFNSLADRRPVMDEIAKGMF